MLSIHLLNPFASCSSNKPDVFSSHYTILFPLTVISPSSSFTSVRGLIQKSRDWSQYFHVHWIFRSTCIWCVVISWLLTKRVRNLATCPKLFSVGQNYRAWKWNTGRVANTSKSKSSVLSSCRVELYLYSTFKLDSYQEHAFNRSWKGMLCTSLL